MEKITVIIIGKSESEHFTVVEYNDKYYEFYTDGYEGIKYKEVIEYLKFLSFDVFEVYKSKGNKLVYPVNNKYGIYI